MVISFTVPDPVAPRLLDALAKHYGYDATVETLTKAQYVKARVIAEWKKLTGEFEAAAAKVTAEASTQTDIVIT